MDLLEYLPSKRHDYVRAGKQSIFAISPPFPDGALRFDPPEDALLQLVERCHLVLHAGASVSAPGACSGSRS
ncbi:hypothetical protein [Rhodococcus opacus]|uniref:hypothetical protein n=1 Tax=Rhodococcus opacus TaxID=37919 RepID=UPI0018E18C2E|nr:hypothetical protein [Rhodococcus opacus]